MVQTTKAWGIAITNGEFDSRTNSEFGIYNSDNVTSVLVESTNMGNIHFSNCMFWGSTSKYIARIYSNTSLSFDNCAFHEWGKQNYAIQTEAGIVRISNSDFYQKNGMHINFKKGTNKGIVMGNTFNGTMNVIHDDSVQFLELGNL